MRQSFEDLPQRALLLLGEDEGQGLLAAGAVDQAGEDLQEELVVGPDLQPATRGGKHGARVDLNIVKCVHRLRSL